MSQPATIHAEMNNQLDLEAIYTQLDPPPPARQGLEKCFYMLFSIISWALAFALPFLEDSFKKEEPKWGYQATNFLGLPQMYGVVVIMNLLIAPLYVLLVLGFGKVGGGRRKYGYKLPLMYPAIDMHAYDVLSRGHLLSAGDSNLAEMRLQQAAAFSIRQRVHHNALESVPFFILFSLIGGIRYPLATAINGFLWTFGRMTWTNGYLSGQPINRYANPAGGLVWSSMIGLIACCIGLASGLLQYTA
eukprot:gb/GEZN01015799.1/.p1 GENE.gb/GEZN01015799.1/~~gb/GEZN01015799.1/.p1  ORF type:complete len:246 (+),score=18.83 gb/GEZN01015799.1/:43-780(+)